MGHSFSVFCWQQLQQVENWETYKIQRNINFGISFLQSEFCQTCVGPQKKLNRTMGFTTDLQSSCCSKNPSLSPLVNSNLGGSGSSESLPRGRDEDHLLFRCPYLQKAIFLPSAHDSFLCFSLSDWTLIYSHSLLCRPGRLNLICVHAYTHLIKCNYKVIRLILKQTQKS